MTAARARAAAANRPFWLRSRRRQQDAAIALSVLASVIELAHVLWPGGGHPLVLLGVLTTLAGAIASRAVPWTGLTLALAGVALALAGGWNPIVGYSVVAFMVFGLAVRGLPPVRLVGVSALALAIMFGIAGAVQRSESLLIGAIPAVIALLAAGATGAALRLQVQYWEALELRAADAVARGELEAERRAAQERLRIARDLHDIIGHNVAVISMHLGVVEVAAGRDQAVFEHSLGSAREAVQSVLSETQHTLALLRSDAEPAANAPTVGLHALPELIASFGQIGLRIEHTLALGDSPDHYGTGAGLIAYRVVQEALTNAKRYGTGTATVTVQRDAARIEATVDNPVAAEHGTSVGTGYGLLGMRERVAAVGGTLECSDERGVFRVHAVLPLAGRGLA